MPTHELSSDGINAILRTSAYGPSEWQVRNWVKLGYIQTTRKSIPGQHGNYASFNAEERFVAVVMGRLTRVGVPVKTAASVARKAWLHRVGTHRVNMGDGMILTFTTKVDGSGKENVPHQTNRTST